MDLCLWTIKIRDKMRILGEVGVCEKMGKKARNIEIGVMGRLAVIRRWCNGGVAVLWW
jgi:hypothetical protein